MDEEMEVKTEKVEPFYRSLVIEKRQVDAEARTVELAFSSETPVSRWYGDEILDHAPDSVRLDRLKDGGAVLVDHDRRDHVGVVENVVIGTDRVGRALVRFGRSARANDIFDDIADGIRKSISIGYRVFEAVLEKTGDDTTDQYRITDWEPLEISIVSIPADPSVGVGRSAGGGAEKQTPNDFLIKTPVEKPEVRTMETEEEKQARLAQEAAARAAGPGGAKPNVQDIEIKAREDEKLRIRHITQAGEKFGQQEFAREAIDSGMELALFREKVLEKIDAQKTDGQRGTPVTDLDLSDKEVREYSLFNAIRAAMSNNWKDAGLELECSREIAERLGKEARGFYVPLDIQERNLVQQQRVMTVGTDTAGGHLKGVDHLAGSFIDRLRSRALLGSLGAQFLPGLVGDVDIPRLDAGATFYWLAEDADVTDSDGTLGSVALAPKTVAGSVPMSRKLLKQSAPSIEGLMLNDLVIGAALAIDAAGFEGTGSSGQPLGIVNQTGINTQTIADAGRVATWAELVGFETKLAEDNALVGSLHYVSTPAICGTLKTTPKDAGSGLFLVEGGMANGHPIHASNQVSAGVTLFGDFSQVLIGMWGVLDVMPDQAAKAASGGLVLRVFQDIDIAVRHPESFCLDA